MSKDAIIKVGDIVTPIAGAPYSKTRSLWVGEVLSVSGPYMACKTILTSDGKVDPFRTTFSGLSKRHFVIGDNSNMGFLRCAHVGWRDYDSTPITVTDPCYNADTWCVIDGVKIKPGRYDCIAWKEKEQYTDESGKKHSYQTVRICGIYLNGYVPKSVEGEQIGEIGVDAGLAGFFQNKPDYDDEAWSRFCSEIGHKDYMITDYGFFTSSGNGDGFYPVFAFKNKDGEIVALEIHF